jgi:hypothetical protein
METQDDVCFYVIGNQAYFLGVVALINSLALTGHSHPIVIGDLGLTGQQREILSNYEHCRLFKLDPGLVRNATQYKPFAYLARADEVVVMIDADMIVTESLEQIIARARNGKLCAFPDPEYDRWFAKWQDIFGLSTAPRHQSYVCAGFVAFSVLRWPNLLEQWWNACQAINSHPTDQEGGDADGPTAQADQDALNALLMSEYPQDAVSLELADGQVHRSDLYRVRLLDARRLTCRFRHGTPLILHASRTPKPWQQHGAVHDAYFALLRRLLVGPDLQIRVPASMIDEFLLPGVAGWVERHRRFLLNMGPSELAISYFPNAVAETARKVKAVVKTIVRGSPDR